MGKIWRDKTLDRVNYGVFSKNFPFTLWSPQQRLHGELTRRFRWPKRGVGDFKFHLDEQIWVCPSFDFLFVEQIRFCHCSLIVSIRVSPAPLWHELFDEMPRSNYERQANSLEHSSHATMNLEHSAQLPKRDFL